MFTNRPLKNERTSKEVLGFSVTNPTGLTLSVASGSARIWKTSTIYTMDTEQSHTFTPHSKWKKGIFMGIVSNGVTTDLWVDEWIHNGNIIKAQPPAGYRLWVPLAWFELLPNVDDFSTTEIFRRIYI